MNQFPSLNRKRRNILSLLLINRTILTIYGRPEVPFLVLLNRTSGGMLGETWFQLVGDDSSVPLSTRRYLSLRTEEFVPIMIT